MKVAVIGTGYVGLVTGTCLAESGNDVVCVDNNPKKIATLNDSRMPIYEPGLLELVQRNNRDGRLSFTTDLAAAVRAARLDLHRRRHPAVGRRATPTCPPCSPSPTPSATPSRAASPGSPAIASSSPRAPSRSAPTRASPSASRRRAARTSMSRATPSS